MTFKTASSVPTHIAIVMDGNGRWARQRGFERLKGHYQGAEALKRTVQGCLELGVSYLTVFAFSTENWGRPIDEITGLMTLLNHQLNSGLKEIDKNEIRLRFIGERADLNPELVHNIEKAEALTQQNTKLHLTIAFNYGARAEIVRAAQRLAYQVQAGLIFPENITEAHFTQQLFTKDIPDPDLFIRTSNEARLSNYLLWQMAYTELVILKTYWPDFTKDDLIDAIQQYQSRERRFGQVSSQ